MGGFGVDQIPSRWRCTEVYEGESDPENRMFVGEDKHVNGIMKFESGFEVGSSNSGTTLKY